MQLQQWEPRVKKILSQWNIWLRNFRKINYLLILYIEYDFAYFIKSSGRWMSVSIVIFLVMIFVVFSMIEPVKFKDFTTLDKATLCAHTVPSL